MSGQEASTNQSLGGMIRAQHRTSEKPEKILPFRLRHMHLEESDRGLDFRDLVTEDSDKDLLAIMLECLSGSQRRIERAASNA